MILNKFMAEMIGTFVFLGVIIITVAGKSSTICDKSESWIKIGLALSIAIILFGKISGGHFNPAVSFMFFLNKTITLQELFIYIVAQLAGAIIAYTLYNLMYKYT